MIKKRQHINLVEKSCCDYQEEVLWKRGAGCTPIWLQLWKSQSELRDDLLAAIPHIDDNATEEVIVRLKSEWLDDRVVGIKKHFSDDKEGTKMTVGTEEVGPTTGTIAYDLLMGKAEELRKRMPHLSQAQAFEKVYVDPANQDLVLAERRGSGLYAKDDATDVTVLEKVARDSLAPRPGRARMEPKDLGSYSNGPSMTPGMREGFPSTDEILALVNAERKKGFSKEQAFDRIAARLINGDA